VLSLCYFVESEFFHEPTCFRNAETDGSIRKVRWLRPAEVDSINVGFLPAEGVALQAGDKRAFNLEYRTTLKFKHRTVHYMVRSDNNVVISTVARN